MKNAEAANLLLVSCVNILEKTDELLTELEENMRNPGLSRFENKNLHP